MRIIQMTARVVSELSAHLKLKLQLVKEILFSALASILYDTYDDDHIDCVRIFIIINIPLAQISSSENIIMCYLFTESNYVDFHRI